MSTEVLEFAEKIGAIDMSSKLKHGEYRSLFKRRNYFSLKNNTFLIVKLSKSKIKPFWGLGKQFVEVFNLLTEDQGTYHLVLLVSNKSGWTFSKKEINGYIHDGSWSFSDKQAEYKINNYNLKDTNGFFSTDHLLKKIGMLKEHEPSE
jgi:hypothetical protein